MVTLKTDGSIEFAFFRPTAHQVSLVGEFNGWESKRQSMSLDKDGWWRATLTIAPGEYKFKYLVNGGLWEADFAAYGVEFSKEHGWTSKLYIPSQAQKVRRAKAA